MAKSSHEQLVSRIHASQGNCVVAVTGGGSMAISELLRVPGGSRTVLEAIVPYSSSALTEFLGARPEQFCSARTARAMAMAGFERARRLQALGKQAGDLAGEPPPAIGIGCTASLASDRPKRGAHRIHVASQTRFATTTSSIELEKGSRSREEEERVAAALVLNVLAESFGLMQQIEPGLVGQEQIERTVTKAPPAWQQLLLKQVRAVLAVVPGESNTVGEGTNGPVPGVTALFPGAFNPLHRGHLQIANIAADELGTPVTFEISIENVDKPPLDYHEMQVRAAQLAAENRPLWFTRAPTFVEKANLFPGTTFIVGADTMKRIKEPRYYKNGSQEAAEAIDSIASQGCSFLVFGRVADGKFETLEDLELPANLRRICQSVPHERFREDISSTQLRQQMSEQ